MVIIMNQAVRRIQPQVLNLGNRITEYIRQALIAIDDAAATVADEDRIRDFFGHFVAMKHRKCFDKFAIPTG